MIKAIKTDTEYEDALEKLYNMIQTNLKKGSAKAKEAEALSILIKEYENIHYPIPRPDLRMNQS